MLGSGSFWGKYSPNGKPLPITKILDSMKMARIQEDRRIVELAKSQYLGEFAQRFSYRVSGSSSRRVLVRPDAIARRYRTLHGLSPVVPVCGDGEGEASC